MRPRVVPTTMRDRAPWSLCRPDTANCAANRPELQQPVAISTPSASPRSETAAKASEPAGRRARSLPPALLPDLSPRAVFPAMTVKMSLITTTESLAETCRRFAQHSFVTVDTEFLRETTFWPKVCVIQIASDDEAVAVDAIAEGLDLTPFFELMANPDVVKVFHAARQDLEIVWNLAKM